MNVPSVRMMEILNLLDELNAIKDEELLENLRLMAKESPKAAVREILVRIRILIFSA